MTIAAKLSGNLPSGDANGIATIVNSLVNDPERIVVMVALADCERVTHRIDEGSHVPTVWIRRIEVISDPADCAGLRRLLMREFERRTGQPVLPLELENDVRQAFGDDDDPPPPPPAGRRKRS